MPVKQKYTTMRPILLSSIILLFLSSCIISTNVHYSDPNYLSSDEFSSYSDITIETISEIEQGQDSNVTTYNNYLDNEVADNYYDYSFSSRLRRFHRPMYYSNYYGGIYTDYYWYNNDPFYYGTSIYYGYSWNSPYYSYSPYYYNNYNSHFAYGHSNLFHNTSNYIYNNNNNYTTGHRGSLSSHSNGRKVKQNTIIPNTNIKTSTVNISKRNTFKNNVNSTIRNTSITKKPYTNIKTNTNRTNTTTKTNKNYRGDALDKTTKNKINRSYTTPKSNSNNRSYNSGKSKSNNGNRSTGGSNRRSVKPRK